MANCMTDAVKCKCTSKRYFQHADVSNFTQHVLPGRRTISRAVLGPPTALLLKVNCLSRPAAIITSLSSYAGA